MNRTTWPLFLCALAISLAMAGLSHGALLAYEGFDYPNDGPELGGRDGGFGWAGAWNEGNAIDFNFLTQDDTSLDSAAFPFTPIGDHVAGNGGGILRQFNGGIDMATEGSVLYVSLLIRKNSGGGTTANNVEFSLGSQTNSTLVRAGSTTNDRWFLNLNTVAVNSDAPFRLDENYFAVLKLVSRATPNHEEAYLAIFGEGDTVPLAEPLNSDDWDLSVVRNINASFIDTFRLAIGANATGGFDEIRIGQTWADVTRVPEPATWGLGIAGLVAIWGLHRRPR